MRPDSFFIGWSDQLAAPTRRQVLAAGLGLVAAGGALGAGLGAMAPAPGPGLWDQGRSVAMTGTMYPEPYLHLLVQKPGGDRRPVFLVGPDKNRLSVDPALLLTAVAVHGTMIERGEHAMMAVGEIRPDPISEQIRPPAEQEMGSVLLTGEILDAKCWFGAMRPGHGKTHKACAALCARGGLPLAFAELDRCADGEAGYLFLNEEGRAHGREIVPLVADPVIIRARAPYAHSAT